MGGPAPTPYPPKAQFPGVVPNVHIPRDAFSWAQRGRLSSEWTGCGEEGHSQGSGGTPESALEDRMQDRPGRWAAVPKACKALLIKCSFPSSSVYGQKELLRG